MKQQPTDRMFSHVSSDYAKHRPSYAASTIDKILEGLQAPSQLVAVDIGAGTGIASRQLAERGVKVLAVEPDPAMIQAATPHHSWSFEPQQQKQQICPVVSLTS